jgi:hypothetical protein
MNYAVLVNITLHGERFTVSAVVEKMFRNVKWDIYIYSSSTSLRTYLEDCAYPLKMSVAFAAAR